VTAAGDQDRARPAERLELINAAAAEARRQQTTYDRFEDAAAAYFGVNRTSMRCMDVLDQLGQLTAGEIAVKTGLTTGAITAMLDRLERLDLVQRLPDPSDRRRVLVQLTDRARQLSADVYRPLVGEMDQFERYSDADLRLIAEFLERATRTLERHAERVEIMAGRTAKSGAGRNRAQPGS
jgi:DNA-binding MarR family transcriptional regulator